MRISDWSSDVCSSDLSAPQHTGGWVTWHLPRRPGARPLAAIAAGRTERHTMNAAWFKARWLLNRRTARTLLWTVLLLAMAVAANVAGIYVIGSIDRKSTRLNSSH